MFWTGAQIQMHLLNKGQHKNLVRPGHLLKGHTKAATSKKCHLGMPAWPNYNQFFKKKIRENHPQIDLVLDLTPVIISLSGLQFSTAFQFHGNCPRVFAYHRKINNLWMSFPTHWSWWNGCTIHASLPYMGSFCWSIFLSDFFMSRPTVFRLLQHYQRIANFLRIL